MIPLRRLDGELGLRILDEADFPAIGEVLDAIVTARDLPWRTALERVDRVPHTSAAVRGSVLAAARRLLGRTPELRVHAREARELVLGHPTLDDTARTERLQVVATQLGITPQQLEAAMWGDLSLERPVELPGGRPSERAIAATANLDTLQRALHRAHRIVLRVWDDPRELWRVISVRGLLATVRTHGDGVTTFEVQGPLALFHRTLVYGRALGGLVPPLADQPRFELAIKCDLFGQQEVRVAPPLLLPRAPLPRRPPMATDVRLARELERRLYDWRVTHEPPPIASDDRLLFPHLRLDGPTTWYVEVIGFATAEYLADKLARYRAVGLGDRVIFCIDASRAGTDEQAPDGARVIWFLRHVDPNHVMEMIQ